MTQLTVNKKYKPIPSALLARVKEGDRKRFEQDYAEANYVLDIIKEAIEEKIDSLIRKEESDLLFSEPGYAAHYAFLMGQRKAARELLNLFPKKG